MNSFENVWQTIYVKISLELEKAFNVVVAVTMDDGKWLEIRCFYSKMLFQFVAFINFSV